MKRDGLVSQLEKRTVKIVSRAPEQYTRRARVELAVAGGNVVAQGVFSGITYGKTAYNAFSNLVAKGYFTAGSTISNTGAGTKQPLLYIKRLPSRRAEFIFMTLVYTLGAALALTLPTTATPEGEHRNIEGWSFFGLSVAAGLVTNFAQSVNVSDLILRGVGSILSSVQFLFGSYKFKQQVVVARALQSELRRLLANTLEDYHRLGGWRVQVPGYLSTIREKSSLDQVLNLLQEQCGFELSSGVRSTNFAGTVLRWSATGIAMGGFVFYLIDTFRSLVAVAANVSNQYGRIALQAVLGSVAVLSDLALITLAAYCGYDVGDQLCGLLQRLTNLLKGEPNAVPTAVKFCPVLVAISLCICVAFAPGGAGATIGVIKNVISELDLAADWKEVVAIIGQAFGYFGISEFFISGVAGTFDYFLKESVYLGCNSTNIVYRSGEKTLEDLLTMLSETNPLDLLRYTEHKFSENSGNADYRFIGKSSAEFGEWQQQQVQSSKLLRFFRIASSGNAKNGYEPINSQGPLECNG